MIPHFETERRRELIKCPVADHHRQTLAMDLDDLKFEAPRSTRRRRRLVLRPSSLPTRRLGALLVSKFRDRN
jgi:hypothetical protein